MTSPSPLHRTPYSVEHQLRDKAEGVEREDAVVTEEVTDAPTQGDSFPHQERLLAVIACVTLLAEVSYFHDE